MDINEFKKWWTTSRLPIELMDDLCDLLDAPSDATPEKVVHKIVLTAIEYRIDMENEY